MSKKKKLHGGQRKDAGRKTGDKAFVNTTKKPPSKVIRVYQSNVDDFKIINKHHPKEWEYTLK